MTASWGVYETVTDRVSATGRPIRNYRRTPVEDRPRSGRRPDRGRDQDRPAAIDEVTLRIDARRAERAAAGRDRVVQRPGSADAGFRWTPGCSRPGCRSRQAARRCSCRFATCSPDWPRTRRRACAGSICSTATGWSSPSGGPARPTGRSPTARGGHRGVDHLAARLRDAADRRRGDRRRAARHDALSDGAPSDLEPGLRPILDDYARLARRTGRGGATCPSTFGRRPRRRSPMPGWSSKQLAEGLEHLSSRCGGAALLPVHEPR